MINKEAASKLKDGQTIFYLGLNYIVHDCKIAHVRTIESGEVEVEFDDGCFELFNNEGKPYMFLTKKDALEAAEYELEGMLEMIKTSLTK